MLDWAVLTALICICLYLLIMLLYYKTLLTKETNSKGFIQNNLKASEVIIRKLQTQMQRSLGNVDILTDELNKIKNDLTALRTRNSQYRIDNDKLRRKIKELEAKIEALL